MPERIPTFRPTPGRVRRPLRADERARKRFYGRAAWRRLRLQKLAIDPLCERCKPAGRTVPAEDVHHVVEYRLRPDLGLDIDNLESLCGPCHSAHTARQNGLGGRHGEGDA